MALFKYKNGKAYCYTVLLGTLRNRRRQPHDGNRKRKIYLQSSLRMYNTLWLAVNPKSRTRERGVSRRDENLST